MTEGKWEADHVPVDPSYCCRSTWTVASVTDIKTSKAPLCRFKCRPVSLKSQSIAVKFSFLNDWIDLQPHFLCDSWPLVLLWFSGNVIDFLPAVPANHTCRFCPEKLSPIQLLQWMLYMVLFSQWSHHWNKKSSCVCVYLSLTHCFTTYW